MINDFVIANDDWLFVEPIYEKENKFATKETLTNKGYIRFTSENLEKRNLKGIAVVFCDGFIKTFNRECVTVDGNSYLRMTLKDIIAFLD